MSIKRLIKKTLKGGGSPILGHTVDAIEKMNKTGDSFMNCLKKSVTETITEDMPISSDLYQSGKREGRVQGTVEQAKRDEKKFNDLHAKHESDRKRWKDSDKKKDNLIDELTKMFK